MSPVTFRGVSVLCSVSAQCVWPSLFWSLLPLLSLNYPLLVLPTVPSIFLLGLSAIFVTYYAFLGSGSTPSLKKFGLRSPAELRNHKSSKHHRRRIQLHPILPLYYATWMLNDQSIIVMSYTLAMCPSFKLQTIGWKRRRWAFLLI